MRVIKSGCKKEDHVAQWNCRECGAVIESSRGEGRYVSDQRDGDCIATRCPECKHENFIDTGRFTRTPKS